MFAEADCLQVFDDNWDTSKVTTMEDMFKGSLNGCEEDNNSDRCAGPLRTDVNGDCWFTLPTLDVSSVSSRCDLPCECTDRYKTYDDDCDSCTSLGYWKGGY